MVKTVDLPTRQIAVHSSGLTKVDEVGCDFGASRELLQNDRGKLIFPHCEVGRDGHCSCQSPSLTLRTAILTRDTLELAAIATLLEEVSHNYTCVKGSMLGVDRCDLLDEEAEFRKG